MTVIRAANAIESASDSRIWNRLMESPDLRDLVASYNRSMRELTAERAKADPQAYKLSRIMDNTSYRYWPAGKDGRGRTIRFCWTCHRNVAGYFLGWREVIGKTETKRDRFIARKSKAAAQEVARKRQNAFIAKDQRERGDE